VRNQEELLPDPTRKNSTSIYTNADVLSLLPDFSLLFWVGRVVAVVNRMGESQAMMFPSFFFNLRTMRIVFGL
jgi:hypothetical protein